MNNYDFIIMLVSHILVFGVGYTIGLKTNVLVSQNVKTVEPERTNSMASPERPVQTKRKYRYNPSDLSFIKDEPAFVPDEPKTPEQIVNEMLSLSNE